MKKILTMMLLLLLLNPATVLAVETPIDLSTLAMKVAQGYTKTSAISLDGVSSVEVSKGTQSIKLGKIGGDVQINWLEPYADAELSLLVLGEDAKITAVVDKEQLRFDVDGNPEDVPLFEEVATYITDGIDAEAVLQEVTKYAKELNRWQDVLDVSETEHGYVVQLKPGLDGKKVYTTHRADIEQAIQWVESQGYDSVVTHVVKQMLSPERVAMLLENGQFEISISKEDMRIEFVSLSFSLPYLFNQATALIQADEMKISMVGVLIYDLPVRNVTLEY